MTPHDDIDSINTLLSTLIKNNIPGNVWEWLNANLDTHTVAAFNTAFVLIPRKTGKAAVALDYNDIHELNRLVPGFRLDNWTIDKLSRVYLLSRYSNKEPEAGLVTIENLFSAAEMNELVALYSALPLLPSPNFWANRCAEGIRSNIGTVLEAIMYHNPYPAANLGQAAWNQMILKAFFTEKDVTKIYGLEERNNPELSRILIDYAKERHAAGRHVNDMLWQLAGKFISEEQLSAMKKGGF